MSQQINLLSKERSAISPLTMAAMAWGVVILGLFVVWTLNHFRLSSARESEAVASRELVEARAIIKKNDDMKAELKAQIEQMRPMAEAADKVIQLVDGIGVRAGYVDQFEKIANVVAGNLWVTNVVIKSSGRSIAVEGQSLDREDVMAFSKAMNETFSGSGVQFSVLEISPPIKSVPKPGVTPLSSTPFSLR